MTELGALSLTPAADPACGADNQTRERRVSPTPDDRTNAAEPTPTAESTLSVASAQRQSDAAEHGPELARAMGELARELARQPDMEAALERITAAVVATVPGARYAGITSAIGRNRVSARASTASIVDDLDRLQAELGQGPCIAAHAAIALYDAAQSQNLRQAVASRDVIGQAKGLLMNRDHTSAEQAFEQLVGASQHANMKLADVARWLVEEHERHQHGWCAVPGRAGHAGQRGVICRVRPTRGPLLCATGG